MNGEFLSTRRHLLRGGLFVADGGNGLPEPDPGTFGVSRERYLVLEIRLRHADGQWNQGQVGRQKQRSHHRRWFA